MKSWEDVAPEPLVFPIGGKEYTVPLVPYQVGIALLKAQAGEPSPLDDMSAEETYAWVLGDAFAQMVDDNVPGEAVSRAGFAVIADVQMGRDMATAIWEAGIAPKALLAAIASATSTATASENGTRPRASTRRTTSRKGSSTKMTAKKSS